MKFKLTENENYLKDYESAVSMTFKKHISLAGTIRVIRTFRTVFIQILSLLSV